MPGPAGRRRALRRGPDPRRPVALVRLNPAEREQVTAAAARAQLSVAAFLAKAGLAAAGGLEAPGGPISGLAAQVYQLRSHLGRVHATLNWLKTNAAVGRPVSAAQLDAAVAVTRRLMDRVGETEQRLSRRNPVIGRVFRGAAVHGLLRYLFAAGSSAGRGNVHVDPRLIAAWDGSPAAHAPAPGNGGTARVGPLAAVLTAPLAGCAGAPDKYVYHLMLRNHHGDRDLSDAEWARLAAEAMAAVGIAPADDPGGCRWVAVRHDDNHIHVVATLAREDGATVNLWRDFVRLRAFCRQAEQRLGLTATAGADQTAAPRAGVREQVTAERTGRAEPARDTLRRVVAAAAAGSATPAEFRRVPDRPGGRGAVPPRRRRRAAHRRRQLRAGWAPHRRRRPDLVRRGAAGPGPVLAEAAGPVAAAGRRRTHRRMGRRGAAGRDAPGPAVGRPTATPPGRRPSGSPS